MFTAKTSHNRFSHFVNVYITQRLGRWTCVYLHLMNGEHNTIHTHAHKNKAQHEKVHKLKHPIVFLRFRCVHTHTYCGLITQACTTFSSKKRQEIYFIGNDNVCKYSHNIRLEHAAFYIIRKHIINIYLNADVVR